jgi:hypothetical protein
MGWGFGCAIDGGDGVRLGDSGVGASEFGIGSQAEQDG